MTPPRKTAIDKAADIFIENIETFDTLLQPAPLLVLKDLTAVPSSLGSRAGTEAGKLAISAAMMGAGRAAFLRGTAAGLHHSAPPAEAMAALAAGAVVAGVSKGIVAIIAEGLKQLFGAAPQ